MALFRNRSLQTKVNLVIVGVLIAFFALYSFVTYRQQRALMIDEAVEKARIIGAEAIRVRQYISAQLLEGKVSLSMERYGLVPQVVSTRIGSLVAADLGYRVRQVSDRYRNPENAPDAVESRLLKELAANPTLPGLHRITTIDQEPVFRYLQPLIAEPSCLECHGDPKDAPAFLHQKFPPEQDRSYHYTVGEVIGAVSVSIPMQRLQERTMAKVRTDLFHSGGILLGLILCLGGLIKVAVTAPLGRLGEGIRDIVRTGRFEEKIPRRGRDEIGILIDGFNEMIDHLGEKTRHLEESERRFRTLTETARDGIVSFLSNGQIILFNRQAEALFGYSKREVLGVSIERLIHEKCADFHRDGAEVYLRNHSEELVRSLHRISGRQRDGVLVALELSLSVAESDGHLFYTAIVRECA